MSNPAVPVAEAVPAGISKLVQVVAPATLEAGYSFLASVDGQTVSITVPAGGVKEGQTFTAPVTMPTAGEATPLTGTTYGSTSAASAATGTTPGSTMSSGDPHAPRGAWKDNLFDCCNLGPFHPSLWMAICLPQFLMAQVLTRMNMTWLAVRDAPQQAKRTFRNVISVYIVYWVLSTIYQPDLDDNGMPVNVEPFSYMIYKLVNFAFALYSLVVMVKLRIAIRERYSIPESTGCPTPVDDCCCVFFCGCCTVSQMARHTANYPQRGAKCCSNNGLSYNNMGYENETLVPAIVV